MIHVSAWREIVATILATENQRPATDENKVSLDHRQLSVFFLTPLPMTVVFDRPYQFVPPMRSPWWPTVIQKLRLYDLYLRYSEGVVGCELRGLEHVQESLAAGRSMLWAPNHCRYADPLVLGWPARQLGVNVHAMASWHLFNVSGFDTFALRRMGAFSIFREGNDRQSIEAAVQILVDGKRPLIVFPEGTTNRTNDLVKPLLDGVGLIARTAARRRVKQLDADQDPAVVVHPVGIKYLCIDDPRGWAEQQLDQFEQRFDWRFMPDRDVRSRTVNVAATLLAIKEMQYLGQVQQGSLPERRDALIDHLLRFGEEVLGLPVGEADVRDRVRAIRTKASEQHFSAHQKTSESELRRVATAADLAQELSSYQESYLLPGEATDTRIVETIQRMQELMDGRSNNGVALKAVIEFAPAIEVSTSRPPKGQRDPVMQELDQQLNCLVANLSKEARAL